MNHADHVRLLREGVVGKTVSDTAPGKGERSVWADLGSGRGAFTLALADLLGPGGMIYSVDRDAGTLREQERAMRLRFPDVAVTYWHRDFTQPLDLPPLDGMVLANSLHFCRDQEPVVRRLYEYLKPGGRLILVEYNADRGNLWVPYPLSYTTWETLSAKCGFVHTRLLATYPSRFMQGIYSALSEK